MKACFLNKSGVIRNLICIIFLLISFLSLEAQLSEYIPLTSGGIDQPSALAIGDLDGDGAPDVISASSNDHRIAWYHNNGAGRFSQQQNISTTVHGATDVQVGDLDGDGDLDIVASASLDSSLVLFFNSGGGVFALPQIVNLHVARPKGVELTDLDQDGDLDILWFSSSADTISWLANDGTGTYSASYGIASELNGLDAVQVVDLDNNGSLDILFSLPNSDLVGWLPNMGDEQYALPIWIEENVLAPNAILAIDLNGDELPEILTISEEDNDLFVFRGLGGGEFETPDLLSSNIWGGGPLLAADLDFDGDQDIFAGDLDGNLDWFVNDGQGAFSVIEEITIVTSGIQDLEIADIDQNGRTDIIVFNYYDLIEWLPNDEESPFTEALGVTSISEKPTKVTHADLNQDGFTDLLVESFVKMVWFPNDGNGGFGSPIRFYKNQYDGAGMLQAGDLNGDGLPDVINGRLGSGSSSDQIRWKANNGAGDFQGFDHTLISSMGINGISDICLADMNGNGTNDVVYAAYNLPGGTQAVGWFESDGSGQFSTDVYIGTETGYNTLVTCDDLDGDGLTDILVRAGYVGALPPGIFWFRNLGGGNFAPQANISSPGTGYYTAFPADLNTDGLPDILAWQGAQGLSWFRNLGDGDFSTSASITTITDIDEVIPLDLDRDGDVDLVYAQSSNGDIKWLENLGSAFFQSPQLLATGPSDIFGLYATDLDGDGYQEILTWSYVNNTTGYYKNLVGGADISGFCFLDQNQNGIFDLDEQPLKNIPVQLEPEGLVTFSDAAGRYRFNVSSGDYTVDAMNQHCWERLVDSTYAVTLIEAPISGPDFGYYAGDAQTGLMATVALSPLRCTEVVPAWVLVENPNCISAPGIVELVFDDLLTIVNAEPMPVSISGDTITWNLDSLLAGQSRAIYLEMQVADAFHTGEVTQVIAQVNPHLDSDDPFFSQPYEAYDTIRCAYDPNDKLVNLTDIPSAYVSSEEELIYTLRFQNTGNDIAFRVRLEDNLNENLDWSTIRPLGASHPYYMTLNMDSGLLEFVFDNILLPDSTADERASHGFVQFAVQLQPGLAAGTVVTNRAGIYFDSNPVVLTNTTETRIIDLVSTDLPLATKTLSVYPNPSSGTFWIHFDRLSRPNEVLNIRNGVGQLLVSQKVPLGVLEQSIDLSGYPSGVYLIQLVQAEQAPVTIRGILQRE